MLPSEHLKDASNALSEVFDHKGDFTDETDFADLLANAASALLFVEPPARQATHFGVITLGMCQFADSDNDDYRDYEEVARIVESNPQGRVGLAIIEQQRLDASDLWQRVTDIDQPIPVVIVTVVSDDESIGLYGMYDPRDDEMMWRTVTGVSHASPTALALRTAFQTFSGNWRERV